MQGAQPKQIHARDTRWGTLDFRGQEGVDHSESAKTASCSPHALSPQTGPRTLQPLCVLDEKDGVGRGLCSFLYQL